MSLREIELTTKGLKNLKGKECDLAFVVLLVIKVAVTADSASGNTIHLVDFQNGIRAGRLAVVAYEVVAS
jgi:hypothetical protein